MNGVLMCYPIQNKKILGRPGLPDEVKSLAKIIYKSEVGTTANVPPLHCLFDGYVLLMNKDPHQLDLDRKALMKWNLYRYEE